MRRRLDDVHAASTSPFRKSLTAAVAEMSNSTISILRAIHPVGDTKLEEVKAEMRRCGPPEIRAVEFNNCYMAIEGSHRLQAAAELGYPVKLEVLSRNHLVEASTLDLDWLEPGKSYAAGYIAGQLYSPHNPIMTINPDGTLTPVIKPNLEEP
jgi:hypothetical protein